MPLRARLALGFTGLWVAVSCVPVPPPPATVPPCVSEDGPGPCFWEAGSRGNGTGWDFIIDAAGNYHYGAQR